MEQLEKELNVLRNNPQRTKTCVGVLQRELKDTKELNQRRFKDVKQLTCRDIY